MIVVAPLVLVPGLAIGSFLGVVAARVPLRRSVVRPGSACMSCETPIRWYDNVPVLSYALLGGRCRRCGTRIPPRDLAIELTTAFLLAGCVLAFGFTARTAAAAIACAAFVVVTATDLERRIVPNRVVLPAAAAVLVLQTVFYPSPVWAIGAACAAGFLLLAALAYPGGMGMGDVKLALLIGALLGRHDAGGTDARTPLRARPQRGAPRTARDAGAEDEDSVRPLPGRRGSRRPIRRPADPPRLLGPHMRRLRCPLSPP